MDMNLAPNETLLRKGGANLQRGWEAVGGRLFLTHTRLVFRPHRFNGNTEPAEIPLADIVEVKPCWTRFLGFIPIAPNSLAIRTRQGEHRFVLFKRSGWARDIASAAAKPDR